MKHVAVSVMGCLLNTDQAASQSNHIHMLIIYLHNIMINTESFCPHYIGQNNSKIYFNF